MTYVEFQPALQSYDQCSFPIILSFINSFRHSSKSRRKSHRKKYSLKEGSRFEDFALMEALAQIVNSVDKLQGWYEMVSFLSSALDAI